MRVPTVNPPGENYREICELVAARLAAAGLRDRVRARRGHARRQRPLSALEPGGPARGRRGRGLACTSTATSTWSRSGSGWTTDPFGGALIDGRIYGRGTCDMKGGLAAAIVAVEAFLALRARTSPAPSRSRRPPTRRPAATAASPTWRGTGHFAPGRPRHHPRAAEQGPGLPRPPRRLVGRARDLRPHRPRLDAVPRRLRGAAHGRGDRRDGGEPLPGARRAAHGDAGGAGGGAGLDAQHQLAARRPGRAAATSPAGRRRWCPTAAGW